VRTPDGLAPGQLIVLRNRKFDGTQHWVVPGRLLGTDRHGVWIVQPAGSFCSRPRYGFLAETRALLLVPHDGGHVVTFHDAGHRAGVHTYVDIATDIQWSPLLPAGWEINLIDMDLDVIRMQDGTVFVDDEEEFAEHRALMDYPPALAAAVEAECDRVLAQVTTAAAPFDGAADLWFGKEPA
jgi:uncharacterized protein